LPSIEQLRQREFGTLPELIRAQAQVRPSQTAIVFGEQKLNYAEFDRQVDRIAASLQRDGVLPGDNVAICATSSIEYASAFFGILRAGAGVAPLSPSSTGESLAAMLKDCGAKLLFLDQPVGKLLAPHRSDYAPRYVSIDGSNVGQPFQTWLLPAGSTPREITASPDAAFNIIYSSGTTGTPKGIVQPNRMRWVQLQRAAGHDYQTESKVVTLISTPLYSNTTLVSFLPTLAGGGTVVLMPRFEAATFLGLAEKHRVTHAMLVPVQYQRIMSLADFDRYDLSSFVMKYSTSAPFSAALKADVLKRWPGGLTEYYGMTEGGGSCHLLAHEHPDKLHTVGRPMPGHEMRLIDEQGREVPQGEIGEVVGRSPAMMHGYFNQPDKTSEAEWYDAEGKRFIRTGDVGRFDADGFLTLMDRKKDMIISGGFNVYPSDLEAVLVKHPAVLEAAVVGVPSEQWGETPVAFVVLEPGASEPPDALCTWVNERVGKTQRLSALKILPALPRSAIGKVLKRELRDQ
jgi:long-chain acyl-CoA synthetase